MISLPNACYCSPLSVLPKNWKARNAPIKSNWQIYYRFYDPGQKADPRYTKGKLVRLKGMNHFKNLAQRQTHTQQLITQELNRLKQGYNPILGDAQPEKATSLVQSETPFLEALTAVASKFSGARSTKNDLKNVLALCGKAAHQLRLTPIPICQISRKHIKMLFTQIEVNQGTDSAHRYNKVRSYLMILFKELRELEAVESNPVREISKRQHTQVIRTLLSLEERSRIDKHLRAHHYPFWLFTHIFFHSGARIAEILQVKGRDVDLANQCFIVTIKKGKQFKQVAKPIKNTCVPFWQEVLKGAAPDDYLFSVGLWPGKKSINRDQITRRWKTHVKTKLGVAADFYSLKHLHLDEIAALTDVKQAAAMASHTSTNVTLKHYTVNEVQRRNEQLKQLNNAFA